MVQTHSNKIFGAHTADIFPYIPPKINQKSPKNIKKHLEHLQTHPSHPYPRQFPIDPASGASKACAALGVVGAQGFGRVFLDRALRPGRSKVGVPHQLPGL
jgi:hypothetical protein